MMRTTNFTPRSPSWGIETFADLAALPENGIAERLGSAGVRLRRLARGMTSRPLVPAKEDLLFKADMELEHALELLEPLLFILSRLLTEICKSLASHALAANELKLVLDLEKNREYTRTLCLPFATRDAQTFLKLLQYDLSAHPPEAANRWSPFDRDSGPSESRARRAFYPARSSAGETGIDAGAHRCNRWARQRRHTRTHRYSPPGRISPDSIRSEADGRARQSYVR